MALDWKPHTLKGSKLRSILDGATCPFTGKPFSQGYKRIHAMRKQFPVYKEMDTVLEMIQGHQCLVFTGETGSGKTTLLPQFAMMSANPVFMQRNSTMVGVTQPRVVATRKSAERIALEMDVRCGEEFGYSYKKKKMVDKNRTIGCTMTDGML